MSDPASPTTNLANLIGALLAPMFHWSTAGDISLACTAAAQMLKEYRVQCSRRSGLQRRHAARSRSGHPASDPELGTTLLRCNVVMPAAARA